MSSQAYLENLTSDNASDPLLALLTISHPSLAEPIRLVRDYKGLVSRGETFTAFYFDFARPSSGERSSGPAQLRIDNIDRRIVSTIRALSSPPTVLIEVVAASSPDLVEESLPPLKVMSADADRMSVMVSLENADEFSEPVCKYSFSPSVSPALYT